MPKLTGSTDGDPTLNLHKVVLSLLQNMTQIDASQHGIHTLEELGAAEGAHILIAGEDGQGDYSIRRQMFLSLLLTFN